MLAGGARYHADLVPSDDTIARMYTLAIERLSSAGLVQRHLDRLLPIGLHEEERSRRQLEDPLEHRLCGVIRQRVREEVHDAVAIRPSRQLRVDDEGLDLGREAEPLLRDRVVERLDAEPVARAEEASTSPVPDGEREHAVQAFEAALSPLRVRSEQHLGVTAAPEPVAA